MTNKQKIESALDLINQTNQGYGDYFFKEFKKTKNKSKSEAPPITLAFIAAYDDNEFTEDFYYFVREMKIDMDCGCGKQNFLDVLVEDELKPTSFKSLMTQLASDYINNLLQKELV